MADIQVDDETFALLEKLAIVGHSTPEQVIARLIAERYDQQFPGRRQARELPRIDMAWPRHPIPVDPEAERHLDELLAQAEQDAARRYGSRRNHRAA